MLSSLYKVYQVEKEILGPGHEISFVVDVGGWGPSFTVKDNKLIPSDRGDRDIYPDFYFPTNILDIPLSNYDYIVMCAVDSIGGGINTKKSMMSYGQIAQFQPKANSITDTPISEDAYTEITIGFLESQGWVRLLKALQPLKAKKIIIEQPFLSESVINNSEWILSVIYNKPIEAYKFFTDIRRHFLMKKSKEFNAQLIPALYGENGFTPSKFITRSDLFHTNEEYAKNLYRKISELII